MGWSIKVNGEVLGTYPTESFARAAFIGVCQSRPKNKYTVTLLDASGAVRENRETEVKAGGRKSKEPTK